jgi:hypothetical protein
MNAARLGVCICFMVASGFALDAYAAPAYIPNSGFETWGNPAPNWTVGGTATDGLALFTMDHPNSGDHNGRAQVNGNQTGQIWVYNTKWYIPTEGMDAAYLNAFIRTNMVNVYLNINEHNSAKQKIRGNRTTPANFSGWSMHDFQAEYGPQYLSLHPDTAYVSVGIVASLHGGSGTNYLDIDGVSLHFTTDQCYLGEMDGGDECWLWDGATQSWVTTVDDGPGHLHNRARVYTSWLRDKIMPVGGVMSGVFTDSTYTDVSVYDRNRDSAIMTGLYLAAESLRFMVTGAPDARDEIGKLVRTLDRWWRISGDAGYLARFAAPANSPQAIINIFDSQDIEDHMNVPFEGDTWHWKGAISRDQYQGVMLGYSLAYQATDDETVKEIIRARVVEFIEQLMVDEYVEVEIDVAGAKWTENLEMRHCVFTDDEGPLKIEVPEGDPADAGFRGFQCFYPNMASLLRQISGFSWLPDIPQRTQAIQLGGMFSIALQVTENVAAYAARRSNIEAWYNWFREDWVDWADGWADTSKCSNGYHGKNIAFMPLWSWLRLEDQGGFWHTYLQNNVLKTRLWPAVSNHKNVFFAFITASQADTTSWDVSSIISSHVAQLELFPTAPLDKPAVDLSDKYSEDPNCPGHSSVAIDVDDRVHRGFLWEKGPWNLYDAPNPNYLHPGVDYLIAYWMARYYGYLTNDAPGTWLRFD